MFSEEELASMRMWDAMIDADDLTDDQIAEAESHEWFMQFSIQRVAEEERGGYRYRRFLTADEIKQKEEAKRKANAERAKKRVDKMRDDGTLKQYRHDLYMRDRVGNSYKSSERTAKRNALRNSPPAHKVNCACDRCGKGLWLTDSEVKKNKRHFCGVSCRDEFNKMERIRRAKERANGQVTGNQKSGVQVQATG